MRRGRSAADQEGLRRVLLLAGVLLGVAGIGFAAWGLASDGWGLVLGPVLVLFAVACVVVAHDDGRGRWCPECVARNPDDATVCERCGASLG